MPTAIFLESEIHVKQPESTDKETVCGISYTEEDVEEKAHSGVHYADHVLATLRTRIGPDVEDECDECISFATQ